MSLKGLSQLIEKLQYKSLKTHYSVFFFTEKKKAPNYSFFLQPYFCFHTSLLFCASFLSYFYTYTYVAFSASVV